MDSFAQIQTFLEVARTASFTRAAENLSLPRSTIAARIKALEGRLQVRLFQRSTRHVALTAEGETYRDVGEKTLSELASVEAAIGGSDEISGLVRIAVRNCFPMARLAAAIARLQQRHKDLRVHVQVADRLVDLVAENYDIALRGQDPGQPGLIARRLVETEMAFFARPGSFPAGIMAAGIAGIEVIDPSNVLGRTEPTTPSWTNSFALAKEIAAASDNVALLPVDICAIDVAKGRLARIATDIALPGLPLFAVFASRQFMPARVRAVLDALAHMPEIDYAD